MRVGRIGYINCYPIYGAVDRKLVQVPGDLVTGTPSELNDLLAAGELGVSVVSAVEYARDAAAYTLLPDLAISSDGAVRSVLLFARKPVERVDGGTILVSQSSRTSVLLLELLLAERWNTRATMVAARAEASDIAGLDNLPHDAVLVIGDAALHLASSGSYEYCYDLGAEWRAWTGLPFVFAVWAARRDVDQNTVREVHSALLDSRAWGLENLEVLAAEAAEATGFDIERCRSYLSGLDYALASRHIEGLTTFFSKLRERGVVTSGSLNFLSVA
jgi:chorismate dehydratase